MIAVIGCSEQKLDHPAPAAELYRGELFVMAMRAARSVPGGRWLILSARYGLVRPTTVLPPYRQGIGRRNKPPAALVELVRRQLPLMVRAELVVALTPRTYSDVLAAAIPARQLRCPLRGVTGSGQMMIMFNELADGSSWIGRLS